MGSRHLKRLALENDLQAQGSGGAEPEEEEEEDESPVQPKQNPFAFLGAEEGSEPEEEPEEQQETAPPPPPQPKGRATQPASKRSAKEEKRKKNEAKKEEDLDELLQSMNISLVRPSQCQHSAFSGFEQSSEISMYKAGMMGYHIYLL